MYVNSLFGICLNAQFPAMTPITKAPTIGKSRFHVTYFTYWIITAVAEVRDRRPDRVTASAYDDRIDFPFPIRK